MINSLIQFICDIINWHIMFWSIIGYVAFYIGYPGFYYLLTEVLKLIILFIGFNMILNSIVINLAIRWIQVIFKYILILSFVDLFLQYLNPFFVISFQFDKISPYLTIWKQNQYHFLSNYLIQGLRIIQKVFQVRNIKSYQINKSLNYYILHWN